MNFAEEILVHLQVETSAKVCVENHVGETISEQGDFMDVYRVTLSESGRYRKIESLDQMMDKITDNRI